MRRLSPHEASEIGKKGGASGVGDSKRRSAEHYQKLVKIRQEKAQKRRLAQLGESATQLVREEQQILIAAALRRYAKEKKRKKA